MAGHYRDTMMLGSIMLVSAGGQDAFIAKLDTSGNAIWATSFGGATDERAYDMDFDANGNIYATGYLRDSMTLASDTLIGAGGLDSWVAAFDPDGIPLWGRRGGRHPE